MSGPGGERGERGVGSPGGQDGSGALSAVLRWPLPALLSWAACWALAFVLNAWVAAQGPNGPPPVGVWLTMALPVALGAALALWPRVASTGWRQVFVALGYPLSVLASGQGLGGGHMGNTGHLAGEAGQGAALAASQAAAQAAAHGLPAWAWLLPLGLLLLAYPVRAWRDAPVFPTPPGALKALPRHAQLPPDASVLDAGCGAGDGLIALHQALHQATPAAPNAACPQLRLEGVEHSWLWWAVSAWRCRAQARVRRGDMWADHWQAHDLVYLFQRPETMPRAWAKARAEMRPGTWLLSLEFEAVDERGRRIQPHAQWQAEGGKPVWLYRLP
jgi:hypothetical protein